LLGQVPCAWEPALRAIPAARMNRIFGVMGHLLDG